MQRTFVGFGFGPIQSGLFVLEAFESGNFDRLVVAEVAPRLVEAIRASGGKYRVNVAEFDRVRTHIVEGVEIYNPEVEADREKLVAAIAAADGIATALPSVDFYGRGSPAPAELLAQGLRRKLRDTERPAVVYAAENHNRAAEMLRENVERAFSQEERDALAARVQFVNTVIGKMSGVVNDGQEIARAGLQPLVPNGGQAVLVEQFNHILTERITLPAFARGLDVFQEKSQLLPFEEAKLYGHNAAHALMGYLANRRGRRFMSEVDDEIKGLVRRAFIDESGGALCQRYSGVDPLFTEAGWQGYVSDLLVRMTNPFLQDRVSRVIRDPRRKLGWDDRLVGAMRLALAHGIQPRGYARGAAAAATILSRELRCDSVDAALESAWGDSNGTADERMAIKRLILRALDEL